MKLNELRITTEQIIKVINTICDFEINDINFFANVEVEERINEVNANRNLLISLISGELHYERVLREDEYDYKYMIFQQDKNVFSSVIEAYESFDAYYDNMDEMQGSSDISYLVTDLLRLLVFGNIEYLNCIINNKIRVFERPDYEEIEKETIIETNPTVYNNTDGVSHNDEFQKLLMEIVDEILPSIAADKNQIISTTKKFI